MINMINMITKTIAVICFYAGFIFGQTGVIDKIVAVIDNEIILQSELDFQVAIYASQRSLDPKSPELKRHILNTMIDEKLVYAQAELDSITVTDAEVSQRIEYQINVLKQQYGSEANIEKMYGMSLDKIKRELRDDVRKI